MGRKFNKNEVSGTVIIPTASGQEVKCNWFCINCHGVGSTKTHYPNCNKKEVYAIPSTAEVPKKNASKNKWDIFKEQFVYSKPVGWWVYYDYSWWGKNK